MKAAIVLALFPCLNYAQDAPALRGFPPEAAAAERTWEAMMKAIPDAARVGRYMERMSSEPHMAGTPQSKAVADYAVALLREWGLDAQIEEFEALLPTPGTRRLELTGAKPFRARLQEPAVKEDRSSANANQVAPFNAYSGSGDVTAPLVYVNYGVPADYETLAKLGIDVKGKIVIARYGGSWRGTKPKVAQERGAVGCLIYSDPRDDGYFQGEVYPRGPFRPANGVQRGSVMDMAISPGDPLSPGFSSEKGAKRLPISQAKTLMTIPVLPISYADAAPLLENLQGPVPPEEWRGALGFTYRIGPSLAKVRLRVEMDNSSHPLFDVIVRIPGSDLPEEWVMYGNHHDAWVHGASDPGSGASSLLETARTLSELLKQGWRPRRTILLALWDGEEFGLVGSTEWLEKHADELSRKLVVYMNSDSNGRGHLAAGGSHTLEKFVSEVVRDVNDPLTGKPLIEVPPKRRAAPNLDPQQDRGYHLTALGSGSDYTAFLQHLGIASLNLGFGGDGGGGVYHSAYDSFYWYTHFSDTNFLFGKTLSQVTGTVLMRMADAPLLPFEFGRFASTISGYADEIEKLTKPRGTPDLTDLHTAIDRLKKTSATLETTYLKAVGRAGGTNALKLNSVNRLLFQSERMLTLKAGLPGRGWYRHSIYAPGTYTGYSVKTLPGVREALEGNRLEEATQQTGELTRVLRDFNTGLEQAERLLGTL